MKRYMDIQNAVLEKTEFKDKNDFMFEIGDIISVQTKIDGSNASIRYDAEADSLVAFSRKKELNFANTLNGFWNYVQDLDKNIFKPYPTFIFFGEWMGARNKIVYKPEIKSKFYLYDIYDVETEEYLPFEKVKEFANKNGLEVINEWYNGEFKGWDSVLKYLQEKIYVDNDGEEEGIVVKNQSKLNYSKGYYYLKIVNNSFRETKRVKTPKDNTQKNKVIEMVNTIVTYNRVEKMIYKLRNEGELPDKILPEDMKLVSKILPKVKH